uniref:SMODS and SLOG-associating 2TM effector domain-containing protein n=1 Tax=Eutreptiella gymnastica TaxID=73025 RepID=A0A7S1NI47_9EUGL|mmetsp:Transcript_39158/g.70224  ORF Transcript_39158/g.70224 Transcript_39158/m.70224 type:complete len:1847 (+) Transcript_39158:103-5643(+)
MADPDLTHLGSDIDSEGGSAVGAYYVDIHEEEKGTLVKIESCTAHADFLLRSIGVIQQTGRWPVRDKELNTSSIDVYFNPRTDMWHSIDTHKELVDCHEPQLQDRVDEVPGGVIHVLGSVCLDNFVNKPVPGPVTTAVGRDLEDEESPRSPLTHTMSADEERKMHSKVHCSSEVYREINALLARKREKQGKRIQGTTDFVRPPQERGIGQKDEDDMNALLDALDNDPEFISQHDLGQHIRHYLSRAIPGAAKKHGAVIITDGMGDISKELGHGLESVMQQSEVPNGLAFVAINAMQTPRLELDERCTHHLLLHPYGDGVTQKDSVDPVSHLQLVETTSSILKHLHEGSKSRKRQQQDMRDAYQRPRQAPRRRPLPIVTILFGGDKLSKFHLINSARQGWPILLIHGSGGYADLLCSSLEKLAKVDGLDRRIPLAQVDGITAEIIDSGVCHVIPKGSLSESLSRVVESSMTGDGTLEKAWQTYSQWELNSENNSKAHQRIQVGVLITGILTTFISTLEVVLKAVYGEPITAHIIYNILGYLIIGFPIAISLLQAVLNKRRYGAKHASLQHASQALLREIYMYRTRVQGYSDDAVRAAKIAQARDSPHVEASKKYMNRQELLQIRLEHITSELQETEVAEDSMEEVVQRGLPTSIRETGDDGLSDLTSDDYVRVRLRTKLQEHRSDSKRFQNILAGLTNLAISMGALGTLLGALNITEPLRAYSLVTWVALTTAINNAITRYIDYSRYEARHKRSNQSIHTLHIIDSWWASRGSTADTQTTREKLVLDVEDLVSADVAEWRRQLKSSLEKMEEAQEAEAKERQQLLSELRGGKLGDAEKKAKELGLDQINAADITAALEDHTSPAADKLKHVLGNINQAVGDPVGKARLEIVRHEDALLKGAKDIASRMEDEMQKVGLGALYDKLEDNIAAAANAVAGNLSTIIPPGLAAFIKDSGAREKFFCDLVTGKVDPALLNQQQLISLAANAGQGLQARFKEMTSRQMLETVKKMALEQLAEPFWNSVTHLKIAYHDLLPSSGDLETFVTCLQSVARLPWRELEVHVILDLVPDREIQKKLEALGETKLRYVLKRAERFFVNMSTVLQTLETVVAAIADLETQDLLSIAELRVEMMGKAAALRNLPHRLDLLPTGELLSFFPQQIGIRLQHHSHVQLVSLLGNMITGTSGGRAFRASVGQMMNLSSNLQVVFSDPGTQERFVVATQNLKQTDVYLLNKSSLVKRLSLADCFPAELANSLKLLGEKELKGLLSKMMHAAGSTFQMRKFEECAGELVEFDARALFPEDAREPFAQWVMKSVPDDITEDGIGVAELLQHRKPCPALAAVLAAIPADKLRKIIYCMKFVNKGELAVRIFWKAVAYLQSALGDFISTFETYADFMLHRIVEAVSINVRLRFLEQCWTKYNDPDAQAELTTEFMLQPITDPEASKCLSILRPSDLMLLYRQLKIFTGDPALIMIFTDVSRAIVSQPFLELFNEAFAIPTTRMAVCVGLGAFHNDDDLTSMDADEVILRMEQELTRHERGTPDIIRQLASLIGGETQATRNTYNLLLVLEMVLAELKEGLGYSLFIAVCHDIEDFNLQAIVTTYSTRQLMPIMCWYMLQSAELQLEEVHGSPIPRVKNPRKDLMRLMVAAHPAFKPCSNALRYLPEAELQLFFGHMFARLKYTNAGQWFQGWRAKWHADIQQSEDPQYAMANALAMLEASRFLKMDIQLHADEVQKAFDGFNSRIFHNRLASEKKAILQKWIQNEASINILAGYDEPTWKRFFGILQRSPVYCKYHVDDALFSEDSVTPFQKKVRARTSELHSLKDLKGEVTEVLNWPSPYIEQPGTLVL